MSETLRGGGEMYSLDGVETRSVRFDLQTKIVGPLRVNVTGQICNATEDDPPLETTGDANDYRLLRLSDGRWVRLLVFRTRDRDTVDISNGRLVDPPEWAGFSAP